RLKSRRHCSTGGWSVVSSCSTYFFASPATEAADFSPRSTGVIAVARVGAQPGTPPQYVPFLSPVTRKSLFASSSTNTWRYFPSTLFAGGSTKRWASDFRGGWICPASERIVSPFSDRVAKAIQAHAVSLFVECFVITRGE